MYSLSPLKSVITRTPMIIVMLFISVSLSSAQSGSTIYWKDLMLDPNVSYFDVVQAFNQQTKGIPESEIPGIGQFRLFQAFRQDMVDDNGHYKWKDTYREIRTFQSERRLVQNRNAGWTYAGIDKKLLYLETPNQTGRIDRIAFDPGDPKKIWAAAPSGGLWLSTDLGKSWEIISDSWPNLGVGDIVIDPKNPVNMYVATGDADGNNTLAYGIQKSIDGGLTWEIEDKGLENVNKIYRLVIDPENPNILYCGTEKGLFISKDHGTSWELSTLVDENVTDIELNPENPNIIYLITSTQESNNNMVTKFYRSQDNGITFNYIKLGFEATQSTADDIVYGRIAVSPNQPKVVIVAGYPEIWDNPTDIYKSIDDGKTFTVVSSATNVGFIGRQYSPQLNINPNNANEILYGSVLIRRSIDGGVTWNDYDAAHGDQHCFSWSPHSGDLWIGNDGGIEHHTLSGIEDIIGLQNAQYWRIASFQGGHNIVMGGVQDNGTHIKINGDWIWLGYGDGMQCWIGPVDSSLLYRSVQYGQDLAVRKLNKNSKWSATSIFESTEIGQQRGSFEFRFAMHPYENKTLYAIYEDIWVTHNSGKNWENLTHGKFDWFSRQCDIEISDSDPKIIYISGQWGQLIRTTDGGQHWTELHPDVYRIYSIEVHPDHPNKLWMSGSGIWESEDYGETWKDISGSLPKVNFRDVEYQPGTHNGIYLVNDAVISVFYKDDDLDDWIDFSAGLPSATNPSCNLDINMADQKLRLGTWGRGIWETDLYSVNPEYAKAPPKPPKLSKAIDNNGTFLIADPYMGVDSTWWYYEGEFFAVTTNGMTPVFKDGIYQARIQVGKLKSYLSEPFELTNVVTANKQDISGQVRLYPNPANERISITGIEVSSVRLFDISGKMIKTYAQSRELDVSSISAGTYIIQILSGEDKVALKRVVILRE